MHPRNKLPGSSAPQTSDEIYTCTKSYGAMNANGPVISQPISCNWVAKIEILIKLFHVEIFHNCLKLPFFGLKISLLFTDLFRIRFQIRCQIRFRIRFRIRIQIWIRIRIRNVSDAAKKFQILTDPVPDPDPQHCLGETDSWKKPEVENLVALSL